MNETWDLLLRILVGTALGGVIGYERDVHGRPAGLRTHMLVALASATFMVASTHFVYFQHYGANDHVEVDPSRIAASVVSGIGFLAGGAILRTGITVQGLTTAAGLWLVAAIGLCAGAGMYTTSVAVTVLGMVVLTAVRRFEDKDEKSRKQRVTVVSSGAAPTVIGMVERLRNLGAYVSRPQYDRNVGEDRVTLTFDLRVQKAASFESLLEVIEASPGVRSVRVEDAG